jgi:putative endonuclease
MTRPEIRRGIRSGIRPASGPASNRRRDAEQRGRSAETLAAWLLRAKGYRILARRFRVPAGEIDLVARRGRIVAFVEVKARGSRENAAEAVSPYQRRRIAAAAAAWLGRHGDGLDCDVRFDAVLIAPRRLPLHLVDCWRPD